MDEKRNDIDVKIHNKVNFYGPVLVIGSIPIVGLPLTLVVIWMSTHWHDALLLSTALVYSIAGVAGVFLLCVTSLLIKLDQDIRYIFLLSPIAEK